MWEEYVLLYNLHMNTVIFGAVHKLYRLVKKFSVFEVDEHSPIVGPCFILRVSLYVDHIVNCPFFYCRLICAHLLDMHHIRRF